MAIEDRGVDLLKEIVLGHGEGIEGVTYVQARVFLAKERHDRSLFEPEFGQCLTVYTTSLGRLI